MPYVTRDGSQVISICKMKDGVMIWEKAPDRNPIIDYSLTAFKQAQLNGVTTDEAFAQVVSDILMGKYGDP